MRRPRCPEVTGPHRSRNSHGEQEHYNTANGPFGLDSIPGGGIPGILPQALAAMENCHTGATCWAAIHFSPRGG